MNMVIMTQKKRDVNGITPEVQKIAKLEGVPFKRIISGKSFGRLLEISEIVKKDSTAPQACAKAPRDAPHLELKQPAKDIVGEIWVEITYLNSTMKSSMHLSKPVLKELEQLGQKYGFYEVVEKDKTHTKPGRGHEHLVTHNLIFHNAKAYENMLPLLKNYLQKGYSISEPEVMPPSET